VVLVGTLFSSILLFSLFVTIFSSGKLIRSRWPLAAASAAGCCGNSVPGIQRPRQLKAGVTGRRAPQTFSVAGTKE
jgi:hypothetical protein